MNQSRWIQKEAVDMKRMLNGSKGISHVIGLIAVLVIAPAIVSSQTDLVVEGHVLGYQSVQFFNMDGATFSVLVKVDKVIKGAEGSRYLVAQIFGKAWDYEQHGFAVDRASHFELRREARCDRTIQKVLETPS